MSFEESLCCVQRNAEIFLHTINSDCAQILGTKWITKSRAWWWRTVQTKLWIPEHTFEHCQMYRLELIFDLFFCMSNGWFHCCCFAHKSYNLQTVCPTAFFYSSEFRCVREHSVALYFILPAFKCNYFKINHPL